MQHEQRMSGALLLAADIRRISNDEGFGLIVGHLLRRVNFLDAGQIKDFFLLNGFHGRRADLKPVEPQGIAADNVSVPAASPSAAGSPEVELDGRDKGHRGDDARSERFFHASSQSPRESWDSLQLRDHIVLKGYLAPEPGWLPRVVTELISARSR